MKHVYGKTKYGIKFYLILTYHVIPRMRNANFATKLGNFGTPGIHFERESYTILSDVLGQAPDTRSLNSINTGGHGHATPLYKFRTPLYFWNG